MKKLFIILFVFISSYAYAFYGTPFQADIPGWMEIDMNFARYYDFFGNGNVLYKKHHINTKEVKITYGGTFFYKHVWIKPYMFMGTKTFSTVNVDTPFRNSPFRDNYNTGVGIKFQNMFYIEYYHRCSHQVRSEKHQGGEIVLNNKVYSYYEGEPTITYDMFIIGIKIKID